jgi:Tfp pilus assembly protein PilV
MLRFVASIALTGWLRPTAVSRLNQAGFSYAEVLVAGVLIALLLTPGLQALNRGLLATAVQGNQAERQAVLDAKLADVLALPFSTLDAAAQAAGSPATPTTLSDTVVLLDGSTASRQVFLSHYDGDNADGDNNPFTGTDAGLLWVQVSLAGTALSLQTLTAQ